MQMALASIARMSPVSQYASSQRSQDVEDELIQILTVG